MLASHYRLCNWRIRGLSLSFSSQRSERGGRHLFWAKLTAAVASRRETAISCAAPLSLQRRREGTREEAPEKAMEKMSAGSEGRAESAGRGGECVGWPDRHAILDSHIIETVFYWEPRGGFALPRSLICAPSKAFPSPPRLRVLSDRSCVAQRPRSRERTETENKANEASERNTETDMCGLRG